MTKTPAKAEPPPTISPTQIVMGSTASPAISPIARDMDPVG